MVKKLVSAATASDNCKVSFEHRIGIIDKGGPVSFFPCYSVELKKSLKARCELVCLRNRILIRLKLIRICKLENVRNLAAALADYILGKVEIFLFSREGIEADYRLKKRGRIKSSPVVRCVNDTLLALALFSDKANDTVCLSLH